MEEQTTMTYVNLAENARAGKAAFVGSLAARDSKRMKLQEMSFFYFPFSQAILTRHFRWGQH